MAAVEGADFIPVAWQRTSLSPQAVAFEYGVFDGRDIIFVYSEAGSGFGKQFARHISGVVDGNYGFVGGKIIE